MTASRTSRRPMPTRRLAAAALAAGAGVALALGGCSAGQVTQTASQVAPVNGIDAEAGPVSLRNLLIEYPGPDGYPAGSDAPLQVRLFNNGMQPITLVGVSADKATSVSLVGTPEIVTPTQTPPPAPPATATPEPTGPQSPDATGEPTTEPTTEPTQSPEPTAAPTTAPPAPNPISITIPAQGFVLLAGQGADGYLRLNGLTQPVRPGESVAVTFTFDDGASVTVPVPLAPPVIEVPRATPVVEPGHAEPGH